MARFNTKTQVATKTKNVAGGPAYKAGDANELIGLIWTSFCADRFYSKWVADSGRLAQLIAQHPEIAGKAAVIARRKFGLRSVTHFTAAVLSHEASGQPWLRSFLYQVVRRADDITEILACRKALGHGKTPNALKRAFAERIEGMDEYTVAKYRGEGNAFTMRDAVFLCHPKHTDATKALIEGTLRQTETWEAKGNSAETWRELLSENKLGYLALLRNIRNIAAFKDAPLDALAQAALRNSEHIGKSLTMPYQYVRALEAIGTAGVSKGWMDALSGAAEISLANLPAYDGTTVIALDGSGSMRSGYDAHYGRKPGHDPWTTARTLAAALYKRCENPLLIAFTERASHITMPSMPTMAAQAWIDKSVPTGGTDMTAVFDALIQMHIKADRVILLTDEQHWMTAQTGFQALQQWEAATGSKPIVHSIDLESYGTCQFPNSRTNLVYGHNAHLFDVLAALEKGDSLKSYVDSAVQWGKREASVSA